MIHTTGPFSAYAKNNNQKPLSFNLTQSGINQAARPSAQELWQNSRARQQNCPGGLETGNSGGFGPPQVEN